jgi:hypothetical protein
VKPNAINSIKTSGPAVRPDQVTRSFWRELAEPEFPEHRGIVTPLSATSVEEA